MHVPILNLVQRGDHADEKWRTLDSKTLHKLRLAVAPIADRVGETRLSQLGYVMVPRLDGNGAEVGGVSQQVMDLFSSRSRALTPELRQMIQLHGKAREAAEQADHLAARPAGSAEHQEDESRGSAHHRRADRGGRAQRRAAAGRVGGADGARRSAGTFRGA